MTDTRGISLEAVNHFKLGLQVDQDGARLLTIPHYERGRIVNVKSRSLPPSEKTFRRVKGCRSILFNGDILEGNPEEVFIAEGEIDAITLHDRGFKNVVGGTTGAGSFEASWIDHQVLSREGLWMVWTRIRPAIAGDVRASVAILHMATEGDAAFPEKPQRSGFPW